MKHQLFLGVFILQGIFSLAVAQQHFQLNGIVLTAKGSIPVPYAHVGIPVRGMGVVSNEVGAFTMNYPSDYAKDSLKVSCLGFKTYTVALAKLRLEDTLIIRLKPEVLELAEAMVKPHSDSGRAIVREALKRLKKNYPTKMHQLNAFYREKVQSRDDYGYTRLMEGMVDIQDWGIDANPDRMRIRLNEFRKSNDLAKQSLGHQAFGRFFSKRNNLYLILTQDPVRIHAHNVRRVDNVRGASLIGNSRRYWLGEILKSPRSSVRLMDMTSYDGELVYHIKFRILGYYGALYINSKDYGIHHIDFYEAVDHDEILSYLKIDTNRLSEQRRTAIREGKKTTESIYHEGKFSSKLNVTYQKIAGKYYLSYIEWMTFGNLRKSKIQEGKTTHSYNFCSLMVSEVQLDKKEMEKVRPRQALSRQVETNDIRKQYNERFWRNYNVLLATPLENKVIRDLTFEESLEQQFKKNQ